MGAAVAVLTFLPSLLGIRPVLTRAQDLVARHLPGSLEMGSCSLGWLEGLRCEQVRYQDPQRGVRVEAPRVTSDKGLLLLLMAPAYLGDIAVEQPVLTLFPPQPKPEPSAAANGAPAASSPAGDEDRRDSRLAPWWERLTVRLKATDGQFVAASGAAPPRRLARRLELAGSLAMGSLHYDLSFLSAQQSGRFQASGFLNLPSAGQSLPEMLIASAEVTVADLEIADFLDLAASRSQSPRGRGILSARLRLNAAGIEKFEAQGETTLHNVQLSGGVLGEDRPRLDQLSFRFAGDHRQGQGWRLTTLELDSDPVRLRAGGSFNDGAGSLTATGSIDLTVLAAQVPRLLRVHEQTVITEGGVDFSLKAAGNGQAMNVRADCRTQHLHLLHDGRPYDWTTPLALAVEADHSADGTTISALHVQTPFFEVQGSGALDGFTLRGSGDLDRMSQELNKIFALNAQAKGQVELTAATSRAAGGNIGVDSRLAIRDFACAREKKALMPGHDLQIAGQAVVSPSFFRDGALDSLRLEAAAWPGSVSLRAEDMRQQAAAENNCTLNGDVDLERLSGLIQGLRDDAAFPVLKGTLRFGGAGLCSTGTKIALGSMEGVIERLAVTGPGYSLREPKVTFALGKNKQRPDRQVALRELTVVDNWWDLDTQEQPVIEVDGAQRRLTVRQLDWASARTTLEVSGAIRDWRQPTAGYSLSFRGDTETALLGELARAAGWLPPDLTLAGRTRGALAIDSSARRKSIEVTLDTASFAARRGKKKLFADPHPMLHFTLDRERWAGGVMKMPSFILRSTPLGIEGAGSIAAADPPVLELQGRVSCNYAALMPLLAPLVGREISVSGGRSGDVLLSLPLQWPVPTERLTFSAQLPVDALRLRGLGFKSLVVPVECNLGRLRCRLDGPLEGGGRATLEPVWELAPSRTALSLAPDGQLVRDAALKPALTDLLGRMHPLFGLVAQPQGAVDVRFDAFSRMAAEQGAQPPTFTVALSLDRARFKPAGALHELLALAGLPREWLSCRERELVCEGNNGRVRCGPVHLLAGSDEIGLRGEMLPDGSLRYRVGLPMNKQLAARIQLVVQGNRVVEAELGGSREKPAFDAGAFLAGLPAQLRQGIEVVGEKR